MNARIEKIFACLGIFLFIFSVSAQSESQKEFHFVMSATDGRGRFAGGLTAKDIEVLVDKKPQQVTDFTAENEAATVVFLIDLSGSRKESVAPLGREIVRFAKAANPKNEYVVLAFNTRIQVVSDKTENLKTLEEALQKTLATEPNGNTAFFDSVYAAIDKTESGKYRKKVLIMCGDGADNQSFSYKENDVFDSLKRSDILFYSVSYTKDKSDSFMTNMLSATVLGKMAEISGGKSFFPQTEIELSNVLDRIALELKSQYRIAFRFSDSAKSGKWRDIKVKVAPVTDGDKKIKVQARARSGFYTASAQ